MDGQSVRSILLLIAVVAVLFLIRTAFRWGLLRLAHYLNRTSGLLVPAYSLAGSVARFVRKRFPRTHAVLAPRLRPDRFSGLPLSLIVVAMAYVLALFGGLVEELFESVEITAFDSAVSETIADWRTPTAVWVFTWITSLGDSGAMISAVAATTGLLWAGGREATVAPLWLTVVGSLSTTWLGKYVLYRPRPEFVTEVTAFSPSFPSGHAAGATAVYGFIAYIVVRGRHRMEERFEIAFWVSVVAISIGFSRVFLGVHYASDVVAGWLLGVFWLLAGVAMSESRLRRTAVAS